MSKYFHSPINVQIFFNIVYLKKVCFRDFATKVFRISKRTMISQFSWNVRCLINKSLPQVVPKFHFQETSERFIFSVLKKFPLIGSPFFLWKMNHTLVAISAYQYKNIRVKKYFLHKNWGNLLVTKKVYPAGIYLFKISSGNTRKNTWNLFKVNNKDTRRTSLASLFHWKLIKWTLHQI